MTDPWSVRISLTANQEVNCRTNSEDNTEPGVEGSASFGFEDSFIVGNNNSLKGNITSIATEKESNSCGAGIQPLPDSQTYLKGLERKLQKIKKSSKLVDALAEKREDCLRNLVQNDLHIGSNSHNDMLLELEASILNNDSAVHNLYRQLQPVQPLTVGETVHIVKYDQLEEQRLEIEAADEEDDSPASR